MHLFTDLSKKWTENNRAGEEKGLGGSFLFLESLSLSVIIIWAKIIGKALNIPNQNNLTCK